MSINTDSIIDISSGGINYGKIGISKTLNSLDLDEVFDSVYCSADCQCFCAPKQSYNAPSAFYEDITAPLTFVSQEYGRWNYGNQEICYNLTSGTDNSNDPLYARIIWLYSEGSFNLNINSDNASGYSLVTQLNAQQWDIDVSDLSNYNSWGNRPKPTAFTDVNIEFMPYFRLYIYEESDSAHSGTRLQYSNINPYLIYKFNDKICITSLWMFYTWRSQGLKYVQGDTSNYAQSDLFQCYDKSTRFSFDTSMITASPIKTWGLDEYYDFFGNDYTEDYIMYFYKVTGSSEWHYFEAAPQNLDALNTWLCRCGFFFKTNKRYKPLISDGYVTGYTDDLTATSDFDNYTGNMQHHVPDTPGPGPTPPGPGPYEDDPWSGATFAGTSVGGAGAFAKVYYMTSTELANLRSWMNSISVPEGFDPMQQIIGLSQVPVALSGSSPENVVFVNSSAVYDPGVTTRAVDTGVATQQSMGTPISYYLGSVDIVRRMQERGEPYLDYDCQIELYLPLIGMFSLDTQAVMGRTISAYAILDPVSGTLAAYAYVTKDGQNLPVAYGSTTIGVDLPISAQQLSVSRAALKQANAQLGTSLLSSALSLVAMTTAGGAAGAGAKTSMGSSGLSAAGIREAGSDYMKASQVGNVFGDFMNWGRTIRQLSYGNNTAISGSFGGSAAQWSYPFTPYVKIIRPRYEKPSNYTHSQGVPCVQAKTVGSCTGFIQCINPDVSGITGATDLELQAIQAALSNGIYAGGGQ